MPRPRRVRLTIPRILLSSAFLLTGPDLFLPHLPTSDDIPSDVLKQMISTHTATCEFLRQFWSAILPTPPSSVGNVLASSSPAEKSAKAAKMVRYLGGTAEKADAVIAAAIAGGSDGEKVRIVSPDSFLLAMEVKAVC